MERDEFEEYLGDGAYVKYTAGMVVLYTTDGISVTNTVCLEPVVLAAFENWRTRLEGEIALARKEQP